MAIFFCVAGGPFGLESLVQESGGAIAIILILLTPIVWAAPAALMTAELASALPNEGGYYVWVHRAFGPFWGFQCAWWTWVYSWIDVAIYPVQFTEYLGSTAELLHLPHPWGEGHPWLKWALGLIVIVPCTWLNIRGAKPVGKAALTLGMLTLAPFAVLVLMGIRGVQSIPNLPPNPQAIKHAFGAGLFVVMWNYLGWDSMSTISAEVKNPRRAFPKALGLAMPIIVLAYLLPVIVCLKSTPDIQSWTEGSWPILAAKVGGPMLAILVSVAAIFAQKGQFMSNLLGISRAPMALAQSGSLPRMLGKIHPRYGTPWVAILLSAGVYTVLSFQSFQELVKFDVLIYASGLILEFAALLWLRKKEPELPRPFQIPGGWPTLMFIAVAPMTMVAFAVLQSVRTEPHAAQQAGILLGVLLTGPVVFALNHIFSKGGATP